MLHTAWMLVFFNGKRAFFLTRNKERLGIFANFVDEMNRQFTHKMIIHDKRTLTRCVTFQCWQMLCGLLLLFVSAPVLAQENANSRQARSMFNKAYDKIFKSKGCSLRYDVNLLGIYKTNGQIWLKGERSHFKEKRWWGWNDGETIWMVDTKKKCVEIHKAKSDKTGMRTDDFTFNPDDYSYHVSRNGTGYLLTLKAVKKKKVKIKNAKIFLAHDYTPISLQLKVLFFWAKITVSDFSTEIPSDQILRFPAEQYRTYKTEDTRSKE